MECTLYLTESCNLCCRYCYEGSGKKKSFMDAAVLEKALEFIEKNNTPNENIDFLILGGEPLLNRDMLYKLFDIIEKRDENIKKLYRFRITTNGIFMDQKIIALFAAYNVAVSISIDGDKETHDLNRKSLDGKDYYEVILKNLAAMQKQKIDVSVRMTAVPNNVSFLYKNVMYFWNLGVRKIHVGIDYLGEWDAKSLGILDQQLALLDQMYLSDFIKDENAILNLYDYKIATFVIHREPSYCSAGSKNHLIINSSGAIFPCGYVSDLDEWKIGSVFTSLDRKKFIEMARSHVTKQPNCPKCEIAFTCCGAKCGFLNYKKTGCLNVNSQNTCKIERILFQHDKKVMEALYKSHSSRILKILEFALNNQMTLGKYMSEIMQKQS